MSTAYLGKKQFIAVEFMNKTHAVVPQLWLTSKKGNIYSYWPSAEISREIITEPSADWPRFKISSLLAESSKKLFHHTLRNIIVHSNTLYSFYSVIYRAHVYICCFI